MEGPRKKPLLEFSYLLAISKLNNVFSNKIKAANVAIKVDANTRPVKPGGDLFDVGGFTGSVHPLQHDPAVQADTVDFLAAHLGARP